MTGRVPVAPTGLTARALTEPVRAPGTVIHSSSASGSAISPEGFTIALITEIGAAPDRTVAHLRDVAGVPVPPARAGHRSGASAPRRRRRVCVPRARERRPATGSALRHRG
jgi:hypothetical protein